MDRADEILVAVTPTWRKPRCAECGRRAAQYDHLHVGWEMAGSQLGTDPDWVSPGMDHVPMKSELVTRGHADVAKTTGVGPGRAEIP